MTSKKWKNLNIKVKLQDWKWVVLTNIWINTNFRTRKKKFYDQFYWSNIFVKDNSYNKVAHIPIGYENNIEMPAFYSYAPEIKYVRDDKDYLWFEQSGVWFVFCEWTCCITWCCVTTFIIFSMRYCWFYG